MRRDLLHSKSALNSKYLALKSRSVHIFFIFISLSRAIFNDIFSLLFKYSYLLLVLKILSLFFFIVLSQKIFHNWEPWSGEPFILVRIKVLMFYISKNRYGSQDPVTFYDISNRLIPVRISPELADFRNKYWMVSGTVNGCTISFRKVSKDESIKQDKTRRHFSPEPSGRSPIDVRTTQWTTLSRGLGEGGGGVLKWISLNMSWGGGRSRMNRSKFEQVHVWSH